MQSPEQPAEEQSAASSGLRATISSWGETPLYFISAAAWIILGQVFDRLLYLFPVVLAFQLLGVWVIPSLVRRLRR